MGHSNSNACEPLSLKPTTGVTFRWCHSHSFSLIKLINCPLVWITGVERD